MCFIECYLSTRRARLSRVGAYGVRCRSTISRVSVTICASALVFIPDASSEKLATMGAATAAPPQPHHSCHQPPGWPACWPAGLSRRSAQPQPHLRSEGRVARPPRRRRPKAALSRSLRSTASLGRAPLAPPHRNILLLAQRARSAGPTVRVFKQRHCRKTR